MPIPSRVLASGNSPLSAQSICGDGATGLVAVGTTAADALQLSASGTRSPRHRLPRASNSRPLKLARWLVSAMIVGRPLRSTRLPVQPLTRVRRLLALQPPRLSCCSRLPRRLGRPSQERNLCLWIAIFPMPILICM